MRYEGFHAFFCCSKHPMRQTNRPKSEDRGEIPPLRSNVRGHASLPCQKRQKSIRQKRLPWSGHQMHSKKFRYPRHAADQKHCVELRCCLEKLRTFSTFGRQGHSSLSPNIPHKLSTPSIFHATKETLKSDTPAPYQAAADDPSWTSPMCGARSWRTATNRSNHNAGL